VLDKLVRQTRNCESTTGSPTTTREIEMKEVICRTHSNSLNGVGLMESAVWRLLNRGKRKLFDQWCHHREDAGAALGLLPSPRTEPGREEHPALSFLLYSSYSSVLPTCSAHPEASWQETVGDAVVILESEPHKGKRLLLHMKGCELCHKIRVGNLWLSQKIRPISTA
jgi:hypothetical protein